MGRIVIACYVPKPGKERELNEVVKDHYCIMQEEGLVTDRKPIIMKAADGTVVEVFEWLSKDSMEAAHNNKEVMKMWERFAEVSDYLPIGQVPEGQQLFSEFECLS